MAPRRRFGADRLRSATVRELIEFGAAEFEKAHLVFGHGTDNAFDEAAGLAFHVLGLDHEAAGDVYDVRPGPRATEQVLDMFARRIESRTPAAYLTGRMWFAGLEFEVDRRVLVPRSPFAELILSQFEPWIDPARIRRVLEIGTGSGCIAIACAAAFPEATVDAVDLSPDSLEVAGRNVARHALGSRVTLLQGDVYGPVLGRRYDLIVSNPPYVSEREMASLPEEYRHEPDLALRAGEDGLAVVRRILARAAEHLEPNGALFVEVGDSEVRLQAAFPTVPFVWLEFEMGGGGVFMLTKPELDRHRAKFGQAV